MSDLKSIITQRLVELRHDCALQRLHLRNAHGRRWSGCKRDDPDNPSSWDLHWETSTKTVDVHVLALRRKLGDAIEIATVRGVGYRLVTR